MTTAARLRVAVIGCGAVVEQFHAPALATLASQGTIDVVALCDPAEARLGALSKPFPRAARQTEFEDVLALRPDLALVASPPAMHARQVIALLDAGVHVLCEKPLVPTEADADAVIAAAVRSRRLLAVGLVRRCLSATRDIRDLILSGTIGELRSAVVTEVGGIDWPFRSAAAFNPALTPGGVLLDIGAHAFDLLTWWFPEIRLVAYQDDAMGGAESNAVAALRVRDAPVTLTLSRDWPIRSRYALTFDHARIVWDDLNPSAFEVDPAPGAHPIAGARASERTVTWSDAFLRQIADVIKAVRGLGAPAATGADVLPGLRLIDDCYRARTLLVSPWFSEPEQAAALVAAETHSRC